jgi:hypothetical protein
MSEKDKYLEMLKRLQLLISAGKDEEDNEETDALRDEMDIVWYKLSAKEQAEVRSIAAQD